MLTVWCVCTGNVQANASMLAIDELPFFPVALIRMHSTVVLLVWMVGCYVIHVIVCRANERNITPETHTGRQWKMCPFSCALHYRLTTRHAVSHWKCLENVHATVRADWHFGCRRRRRCCFRFSHFAPARDRAPNNMSFTCTHTHIACDGVCTLRTLLLYGNSPLRAISPNGAVCITRCARLSADIFRFPWESSNNVRRSLRAAGWRRGKVETVTLLGCEPRLGESRLVEMGRAIVLAAWLTVLF